MESAAMTPSFELRTCAGSSDIATLHNIYHEAFPPEERREWSQLIDGNDRLTLLCIYVDNIAAGMVTYWHFGSFVYIEHLAIDPALRGHGIGSAVVNALRERIGHCPIVLEIEPPESSAQAARRIEFYRRLGFNVLSTTYIQPPYASGLPSVSLWLLTDASEGASPGASSQAALDADSVTATLHRHVYGLKV